jgi:Zn-finger nucleic acid-binding protein
MRCARCLDVHLTTEEFQGHIIETCPRCYGVWLMRHDFDTLIARRGPPPRPAPMYEDRRPSHEDRRSDRSHDSSARLPAYGRRRSWLSDLFD